MVSYPGDLTPEQRSVWTERFRDVAEQKWGAERADAIDATLRKVAVAVGRLDAIKLTPTDAPAFFLGSAPAATGMEPRDD